MTTESIMPISTQKIALQQFNNLKAKSSEPAQQLNQMFFSLMMKSMFDVPSVGNDSTGVTKLHQELYVNTLAQELASNFDVGFSELQFELKQREK